MAEAPRWDELGHCSAFVERSDFTGYVHVATDQQTCSGEEQTFRRDPMYVPLTHFTDSIRCDSPTASVCFGARAMLRTAAEHADDASVRFGDWAPSRSRNITQLRAIASSDDIEVRMSERYFGMAGRWSCSRFLSGQGDAIVCVAPSGNDTAAQVYLEGPYQQ